ncbi:NUDIX domain-containing protein [archaeon]|nr:NUDIX domain-containing protein [archaeon]
MSVRKAVVGIIFLKHDIVKFLLLHRKLGWDGWEFPKGGVERKDKDLEEVALKREISEETGLENIRVLSKIPFEIKYDYPIKYRDKYKHTGTVQSVFLVRAFSPEIKLSIEHSEFMWLPYEEAMNKLTFPDQKKALEVAWKELNKNV